MDFYYNQGWQGIEDRVALNGAKDTVATVAKYQYVWDKRYLDALCLRDENKNGDTSCIGAGDERLYYAHDTIFSVRALVNTAGTVVERYKYDAYGKVTVCDATGTPMADPNNGSYDNQHYFTGQRKDKETQVMYYKMRYYETGLGKFVGRDPLKNRVSNNSFEYVKSRATKYMDYSGKAPNLQNLLSQSGSMTDFCGITLCRMITNFIKNLAMDPEIYHYEDFVDYLVENTNTVASHFKNLYEKALIDIPCDHKSRGDSDDNPCCCTGFKKEVKYNGTDNLRHFSYTLMYGSNLNYLQTFFADYLGGEIYNTYWSDDPVRAAENRAEIEANGQAREAHRKIQEQLDKYNNGDEKDSEESEAAWKRVKGFPHRLWNDKFCE
jgi:RHS repeat-associated protein